jgi:hypothetical protein
MVLANDLPQPARAQPLGERRGRALVETGRLE